MKEYFRGDTFIFPFTFENENGESINFEVGDILRCGIKSNIYSNNYILIHLIEMGEERGEVTFEFSANETKDVKLGKCLLELELTRGGKVSTIYQEEIEIKGDVVRNESST